MRLLRLAVCLPFAVAVLSGCPSKVEQPPALAELDLGDTTVGATYSKLIAASGGAMPYKFSATGLPAGLTIAEGTGTISGSATASGDFNVTVNVSDANGASASRMASFKVFDA